MGNVDPVLFVAKSRKGPEFSRASGRQWGEGDGTDERNAGSERGKRPSNVIEIPGVTYGPYFSIS